MRRLIAALILWALAFSAGAHVGSPNVFFEGPAGGYSIYAVIRPPVALPGAAEVSVQLRQPEVTSVSLLPVLWQAGREGSPPPVLADAVRGETNLWSGQVWFLRPGSYTLQIVVEGAKGRGEALVPVNVLGLPATQMKSAFRTMLIVPGIALFLSALAIVKAVARDASLVSGVTSGPANNIASRRAVGITALLLTAGVAAGALRWRSLDLVYRDRGMQKPEPVLATVLGEPQRLLLELQPADQSPDSASWAQLVPDHGKLVHLFLIHDPGLDAFAHLHPLRQDGQTFMLELPPLPAGNYQLYGELTFENGLNQTLVSKVVLPEPLSPPMLPPLATNGFGDIVCGISALLTNEPGRIARDMDDSWHIEQNRKASAAEAARKAVQNGACFARLMGGYSLIFENAQAIEAGRDKVLRFAAFAPDGKEVSLQSYMGMPGHAAVRCEDGSVFAHLHPSGSFSMASQQLFRDRLAGSNPAETRLYANSNLERDLANRVAFPYEFPKPGKYRIWIQVRVAGRVLTGVFDIVVQKTV